MLSYEDTVEEFVSIYGEIYEVLMYSREERGYVELVFNSPKDA